MRVVAISDTHMLHEHIDVPDGDVLIHAGDMTSRGSLEEVRTVGKWMASLPHEHIIVIAGNHDWAFQRKPREAQLALGPRVTYLQDSGCTIDGFKFWGSPWQPEFYDWAFNLPRGAALKAVWDRIPRDTDVLVTHGPPLGFGDCVRGQHVGCADLLNALDRVSPRVHVYGHIHEGYGSYQMGRTKLVNAAACDGQYVPNQAPIEVTL